MVKSTGIDAALSAEQTFQKELTRNRQEAYQKFISKEVRMMVTGQLPFVGASELGNYLHECPVQTHPKILGTETASSGDLGYVYGTVDVSLAKNGTSETKKATFVRVWKLEGGSWRIVLEVVTF